MIVGLLCLLGDGHDALHGGVDRAVVREDALGREGIADRTSLRQKYPTILHARLSKGIRHYLFPPSQKYRTILHAIPEGHGMPDVAVVRPGDRRPDRHLDIGGVGVLSQS